MDHKEILDDIYRTLATLDDVLRTSEQSDATKLYWIGRAVSEIAAKILPFVEAEAA